MAVKTASNEVALQMAKALNSDDEAQQAAAWSAFADNIANQVRQDVEDVRAANDMRVLESRDGYRPLTDMEREFYQNLSVALKDPNITSQSFIDILKHDDSDELMPDTIIQDVMKDLAEIRPLLKRVKFQYVAFTTKWILNDSTVQKGAWGPIDATITAEIQGSVKVIDVSQNKYSAFCIIPIDILEMGPQFLDAFIRAILSEAMAYGIEDAIVNGSGVGMPIGITRDPDGTYDQETGYPELKPVKVSSFEPAEYGALTANLVTTKNGHTRIFSQVQLICNMVDYLTKVMPATTMKALDGTGYVHDLFPFPTEVIPSTAVKEGTAIQALLDEYTYLVSGQKNGVIQWDDSCKFIDDARVFKIKTHGAGRMYDNTCAQVLDISELSPSYVTVNVNSLPAGAAASTLSADSKPTA